MSLHTTPDTKNHLFWSFLEAKTAEWRRHTSCEATKPVKLKNWQSKILYDTEVTFVHIYTIIFILAQFHLIGVLLFGIIWYNCLKYAVHFYTVSMFKFPVQVVFHKI